tara:strand:- start:605 stop:1384 length:780 start_codon:yes stop_codon:yes gene_type:complete
MSNNTKGALFSNTIENSTNLSIDDLNKYLPAVQNVDDLIFDKQASGGEVFYGLGTVGLMKIPENTIDLIITEPPNFPITSLKNKVKTLSINEYLSWNRKWIDECFRILKDTGSIYLICDWKLSGMYQSILDQKFKVRTRISWKNRSKKTSDNLLWNDNLSDTWFATKSNNYVVNQKDNERVANLWYNVIDYKSKENEKLPKELLKKIIRVSSYKLNWVLDPFCRTGTIGANAIETGRRFIGFEANKDKLLLSMKKIDRK